MSDLFNDFKEKIEVVVTGAADNFRLARSVTDREKEKMFSWGKIEGLAWMAHAACPDEGGKIDRVHRSALEQINAAFREV